MKKRTLFMLALIALSTTTFAGGILTNTNQSIAFLRMLARGAAINIDGVYYNPAGLVYLPEGMHLSLSIQSAYQTRSIGSMFTLFPGDTHTRNYKADVAAPVLPSLQAAYITDRWAFSGSFAVVGGGGNANFKTGLPMFDKLAAQSLYRNGVLADTKDFHSSIEGSQYIFGMQLGASYRISDNFSAFAGVRTNYMMYANKGSLEATLKNNMKAIELGMDMTQKAIGFTPVLGLDVKFDNLNIGLKYEFITKAKLKNATTLSGQSASDPTIAAALTPYADGVKVPNDIPAYLQAAIGYEILPNLRASVEYHHFYDKQAEMGLADAEGKQKQDYLTGGTDEFLAGVEWDINERFTVSGGWQKTNYGLADGFQSDLSFSCDSYSIGFGGAVRLNDKMKLNVAYFWTTYDDYHKDASTQAAIDKSTYSRTNKVFGVGLDYRF